MRLLFFSKYPPIVGGVSVAVYWKTYLLAQAGIEVFIVSNACQASAEHQSLCAENKAQERVKLFFLSDNEELSHIPHSKAYATRLLSLGCEILKNNAIDLIEAFYLEPYGLAAAMASAWFGVPYGLKHAGSDLGRLFRGSEYQPAFAQLLRKASYVITGINKINIMRAIGVSPQAIMGDCVIYPVKEYFNPFGEKLDINGFFQQTCLQSLSLLPAHDAYAKFANTHLTVSLPTIGIYGKASKFKGHRQLLKSLGELKKRGYAFNCLLMVQGNANYMYALLNDIIANELAECTKLLPFLPTWEVAKFIRACSAVCYLENNFPIQHHNTTRMPLEILACGCHLIISEEAFAGSFILKNMPHLREHCTIVAMNQPGGLLESLKQYFDNADQAEQQARQFYELNFSALALETRQQAKKVAEHYEKLLKKAKLNFCFGRAPAGLEFIN